MYRNFKTQAKKDVHKCVRLPRGMAHDGIGWRLSASDSVGSMCMYSQMEILDSRCGVVRRLSYTMVFKFCNEFLELSQMGAIMVAFMQNCVWGQGKGLALGYVTLCSWRREGVIELQRDDNLKGYVLLNCYIMVEPAKKYFFFFLMRRETICIFI